MGQPDPGPAASGPSRADLERDSLTWRRDFLARLIPDLAQRRRRTRDGEDDTTGEMVQRLRLRVAEIEAELASLDSRAGR